MKILLLAALWLASIQPLLLGGELREEVDSYEEAFHHALHNAPEIYLICFYQVEKKVWAEEWEQLKINATVVDVVKGALKVGERIEFERVLDGKYGDISKLEGSLYYVQFHRNNDEKSPRFGKLDIDPQDPFALFRHSPDFSVQADKYKKKAQSGPRE
jgi:hypothetical protein